MTEFRPNPLYQHGVVSTNTDGMSINDITPLFAQHRQAVVDAQSEAAVAKANAQKAKDAADAAARLAEQARQDAETLAAQAAALESKAQVAEGALAREEAVANTEAKIEAEYGITLTPAEEKALVEETEEVLEVNEETGEEQIVEKPKRAPRAKKAAEPTE